MGTLMTTALAIVKFLMTLLVY